MPTSGDDTSAETPSRSTGLDEYSWEIAHDGAVAESGVVLTGERHPWTGSTADTHFEVGAELFDQACTCAQEDSRDAIVEARAEGRPEPEPVRTVSVRIRDRDGTDLVVMTAYLPFEPITDADMAAYHEMMASYAEEEIARLARAAAPPDDDEIDWHDASFALRSESEAATSSVPEAVRRTIDDLVDEAGELRDSVTDPDECRRRVFHAEQRLAKARQSDVDADETSPSDAAARVARSARRLTFWQTRLTQSTETYLEAAALDAEAEQLDRAYRTADRA